MPPVAVLLAACGGTIGLMGGAPQTIEVARGSITIAGPAGYCIDASSSQEAAQNAFVLLGSCASIAGNPRAPTPGIAGALTASVSGADSVGIGGALDRLGDFFQSTPGRAALARNGRAASVKVVSAQQSGSVFFLKVSDTSPNGVSGLAPEYWRALFDLRGRIVTLSVNAFWDKPMSDAAGRATLAAFVARVRAQNPPLAATVAVDPPPDPV